MANHETTPDELRERVTRLEKKREMMQDILSLCPKGDVPIGEQLVAQGLAIIDTSGHIHVDKAKFTAALVAKLQS
jgi:hypothetical protein